MRDYEFRGKRLDNGEWVYGSLTVRLVDGYLDHSKKCYFIQYDYMNNYGQVFTDKFEVDPSTIGQFTGLVDKNGKKIYEGDVVKGKEWERGTSHRHIGIVEYISSSFRSVGINKYLGYHGSVDGSYEVIGNIHDKENE